MRVERVTAHAFGAFSGDALDLAPGLTVVSGPNEAGKSTWHAAIRAGICGVRRGRGAGTKADAAFEERHRPWDGDGRWEVEVRLALDDGRTIELSQDLAGKIACRATDIVLGRDVSDEIMDGTPDASRWLGLDRDAFAATICVGQSQIAAIAGRETAASLQEHMQRAAATRGTDATAAEARERLDAFRREQVGVDRANARGPLRSARLRADAARAALEAAQAQHDAYLDATALAEAAEREAATVARRVVAVEAALASQAASELDRRAVRAAELAARHPTEPAGPAVRDAVADSVAAALDAWRSRAPVPALTGATAADLVSELAALPEMPRGDTQPHPAVIDARRALDRATDALALLGPRPAVPPAPSVDPALARDLARRLRTPEPPPAPELEAELRSADDPRSGGPRTFAVVGAGLLALAAIGALAVGLTVLSAIALAIAVAVGAWGWFSSRSAADARSASLSRTHAALAPIVAAREHARAEWRAATEAAAAAGLPIDPDELERLATASEAAARATAESAAWDERRAALDVRLAAASSALGGALADRGAEPGDDPVATHAAYEDACRQRADAAARAQARAPLERALQARRAAESAADAATRSAERAQGAIRHAAAAAGLAVDAPTERLVEALVDWGRRRSADVERSDAARQEWHELTSLLDGRPLEELRAEADLESTRAASLTARADPAQLADVSRRSDLDALVQVEREELDRARADASAQRGALAEIGRDLPDVAEAEEAAAEAAAELARVVGLSETIEVTLRLLRAAEERVHRDLAPILAEGIGRWLPRVSGGAYIDASVDPADLSVRVKEAATGRWRPALLLSEGTREQIYLLLRAAMAQRLATTGETAPLLLDEPTAQADAERKRQLLGVLHELSSERQIVLFTHDDDVVDWAAETLDAARDRLVRLGTVAIPLPAGAPAALG